MRGDVVGKIAQPVARDKMAEFVARRLLSEMGDHGGVNEFCEKLRGYPEQYLLDLAWAAIDCIDLCQMYRTNADFGLDVTSKPGVA
mgnify:CR=1 FL=1